MSVGNVRLTLGSKQAKLVLEALSCGLDHIRDEMEDDNGSTWSEKDYESALSAYRKLYQAAPKEES